MAPPAANRKPEPHTPTENVGTPGQTGRSNHPVKETSNKAKATEASDSHIKTNPQTVNHPT